MSLEAVRGVMALGGDGSLTLEAVQLVADLLKRRRCVAPPEVLTTLMSLTFSEITSAADFEGRAGRGWCLP